MGQIQTKEMTFQMAPQAKDDLIDFLTRVMVQITF